MAPRSQVRWAPWLCVLSLMSTVASATPLPSIAVIDFEPRGMEAYEAAIIAERFRGQLVKSGLFRVMERGQMEAVLQEQGFQNSGACTDASCVVEMGQLLAVQKMVTGSVGKIGTIYTVDVKVIDIATGQIQMTHSEDVRGSVEEVLLTAVPRISDHVIKETTSMGMTVGYLTVTSQPAGATVTIDGKEVGTTPVSKVESEAGKHKVEVAMEGYVTQERTLTLAKGRTEELSFTLSPTKELLASQKEQASEKRKKIGSVLRWGGVALGVAGVGAAAYFWIDADGKYEDYSNGTDSGELPGMYEDASSSATYGNLSAVAGGVGLVALGVSFAF